jgi:hypothetical protein
MTAWMLQQEIGIRVRQLEALENLRRQFRILAYSRRKTQRRLASRRAIAGPRKSALRRQ